MKKLSPAQKTGQAFETLACQYLEQQGLRLIIRNFRCRMGEIDLIMQDKKHLVFIEVRYRHHTHFGASSETITAFKQAKLLKTAQFYLQLKQLTEKAACRFDVVAITDHPNQPIIEWIKDAIQAN